MINYLYNTFKKRRSAAFAAALALAVLTAALLLAPRPARCAGPATRAPDGHAVEALRLDKGIVQVATDAGYMKGALPGARLELVDGAGRVLGWIIVSASEESRSSGLFEPACDDCEAAAGNEVFILSSGLDMPPGIPDPAALGAAAGRNLSGEDFAVLENAFKAFLDGGPRPGAEEEAPEEKMPGACPAMDSAWSDELARNPDPDADLETDIFIEWGDVLLVSGVREAPFCAAVGDDGVVEAPELGKIIAAGKTIAEFENRVREKRPQISSKLDITLMPAKYMAEMIGVHVIGEAAAPGRYEFDGPVTVKEAVKKAGAVPLYDGRLVLVKRKKSGGAEILRAKVSPPGYDLPDADADKMILGDNDIVFLVRNDNHEKAFLEEVLPFLTAETAK